MLDQLVSLGAAFILFPLVIWVPGVVLGYTANLLGYRSRPLVTQISLGLLLAMGGSPIIVYFLVREGGFTAAWCVYGIVWGYAAVLAIRHRHKLRAALHELVSCHKGLLVLLAAWFLLGALSEIDLLFPGGVYRNLNTMDAVAHVAFTNALTRTGVPPTNPFIYPGRAVPLFYYYLWYLICSLIDQLGGSLVTARAAVQAGTLYVGLAVAALVGVWVEMPGPRVLPMARKIRAGVAIALLTVTGLDLIPWVFVSVAHNIFGKGPGAGLSIEWWNEQVTAWLGAILMSPHHPAGMVICFTGLLLLIGVMDRPPRGQKLLLMGLTPLAFASAAGVSLYVTFAFGAGLALWAAMAWLRGWREHVVRLGIVGMAAVVLYLPLAGELRAASHTGSFPLALTVRAFTPVDYWLPSILTVLKSPSAQPVLYVLRFLFLPLNYFLELGFFFVAALLYWRWRRRLGQPLGMEELLLACIAAGSVLVCTFLRSTFRWNDLGWRGFLVAQFVLLLWAIPVAQRLVYRPEDRDQPPVRWRGLVWFCLVIGVAGTAAELVSMRVNSDGPHGPETLGTREAYLWVDHHTPQDAVVLFNPDTYIEYFNSLYGYRQTVAVGSAYGTFFAVGKEAESTFAEAAGFFARDRTLDELLAICGRYHVGAVVVLPADPVWQDRSSWVWRVRPSFATASSRVFTPADFRQANARAHRE